MEIDINDCKGSISMIENLLETKYGDADDFNLDATESRMNCLKPMETMFPLLRLKSVKYSACKLTNFLTGRKKG